MRLVDLVITIGPQDKQAAPVRVGEEQLEELQRGGVGPLQIIEEDRDRLLAGGDGAQEALEDERESVLRLRRPDLRDLRLRPEDEPELGDEVDEDLSIRADSSPDPAPPAGERLRRLR